MTLEFILRIFVAAILGGLIGLEREYRAKEAGFRTHFLVALGAALFMIISAHGFADVLAGPGNIRLDPSGLTTAAGVWVVAAIGLACGAGMYMVAVSSTLFVLLGLEAFNYFLRKFDRRRDEE